MDNLCNIIDRLKLSSRFSVLYISCEFNYIKILHEICTVQEKHTRNSILQISPRVIDPIHFNKNRVTILIQFRCLLRRYLLEISQLNYRSSNATADSWDSTCDWRKVNREIRRSLSVVLPSPPKEIVQTQREAVPPPRRFDPRYYRGRALATLAVETFHPLATTDCDVRIDPGALEIVTIRANAPLQRPRVNPTLRPSNWISIHSVDRR